MPREALRALIVRNLGGGLTCRDLTEAVTDYLEGTLSLRDWMRFQMHLGICLGCRTYLRQMRHTIRAMGTLPEKPAPPAVRDELVRRFRTWKRT